jgi:HEAT repeat protein
MVFDRLRSLLKPHPHSPWLSQLTDSDPLVRERAVRELGELRDEGLLDVLLNACTDTDDQVRGWALSYVSEIATDQLPLYLAAARDPSPFVRERACNALRYSSHDAIPVLRDLLNDDAAPVRLEAVIALGSLEAKEAIPAITALQQSDPDEDVRDYAASILEDFAERAAPRDDEWETPPVEVPVEPVAVDVLLARLQDPDEDVRAEAALGLAATADPLGYAPLLALLKKEPSGYVRRRVLWALSFYPAEQCIPLLTQSLGDPHESVRYQAVVALQQLCDVQELEMLLAHLPKRVHADVREGLAQAIAEWEGLPVQRSVRLGTVFYE